VRSGGSVQWCGSIEVHGAGALWWKGRVQQGQGLHVGFRELQMVDPSRGISAGVGGSGTVSALEASRSDCVDVEVGWKYETSRVVLHREGWVCALSRGDQQTY
jgi:hypothetical protein